MIITKLEDLRAWQEARILRKMIYELVKTYPAEEKYNIVKHMKECSRNIPGNIAEGFGRFHFQESMQFYRIARGSITELKSDLYCSLDSGFITKDRFDENLDQLEKVLAYLNGLIKSTRSIKSTNNI